MRGRTLALFLVATAAVLPGSARGQQEDVEERRKELFQHGTALAEDGRWQEAADKFREVIALRSAPKALIALGVAEEHLGKLISAKRAYKQAESDARAAGLDEDAERAGRSIEGIRARIPRLVLRLPDQAPVVTTLVDDHRVEGSQTEMELDPGAHSLSVESPGYVTFRSSVTLAEGKRVEVPVELERPAAGAGSGHETSPFVPPVGAAVVGGIGLVLAGTAIGLWVAGRSEESDVRSHCPQGGTHNDCPLDQKPNADAAASKIVTGDVLMPIATAAIVAATVWWVGTAVRSKGKARAGRPALVMSF